MNQRISAESSKDIGRIVRAALKLSKLTHRECVHMYSIYVCSKITQTNIRTNNLKAVKNYSVPQKRKRHSTNVVQ